MRKIDETVLTTKKQYAECFLSEWCTYLDQNHYTYKVLYRSWVDVPGVPLTYDHGYKQTRCDLAIFLLKEATPIHIFCTFKFNQSAYKLDYRNQSLFYDAKNGVRKRDADYLTARKTVREDHNAVYLFAIKNVMDGNADNDYQKRIVTCTFKSKNTVLGVAIRNLYDQITKK